MNFSLEAILNNTQSLIDRAAQANAEIIQNAKVAEPLPPVPVRESRSDDVLFTVENKPLFSQEGNEIKNFRGLFVGDKCINTVSKKYEIHQPSEILQTFRDVAEKTGLTINKVIPNANNGGILISAKHSNVKINGESHDVNLTLYSSHCGRYPTFLTADALRIACHNQAPLLYRNKARHIVREKHYKNALKLDNIAEILTHLPETIEAYAERANALLEKPLTFKELLDRFVEHYKLDQEAKQYQTKLDQFKAIYFNAPGQSHLDENAYKAYQAITYLNTHGGRDTDYREENVITRKSEDSLKWLENLVTL